ncbi:hypothetical protein EHS39_21705 [Ensifer sp. MPMI2T]|nr:hypothetical protein EHS39_21705 [Ensifer sp. MPMI2T]
MLTIAPHPNPLPARGARGRERGRRESAPRVGRRWRQPDEGEANRKTPPAYPRSITTISGGTPKRMGATEQPRPPETIRLRSSSTIWP